MTITSQLKRVLDDYAQAQQGMASILKRRNVTWRKEYLGLRNRMALCTAELYKLEPSLAGAKLEAGLIAGFHSQLSTMRHFIALHQASWPVVAIDPDDPAYQRSFRDLAEARRRFLSVAQLVAIELRRLEEHPAR